MTNTANVHTAHSIASSFEQGDNLRLEAARNFSKAQSLSTFASQTQENAASVDTNYSQAFYEWLRKQPALSGQGNISNHDMEAMASHDPALLQSYADRFVQEKTTEILAPFNAASSLGQSEAFDQAASQQLKQNIASSSQIESAHQQFDRFVKEKELPKSSN